jgi:hypothetical protein
MKILFICGGLAPGKDGVGDYTRKLAAKLISLRCDVSIIAINDQAIISTQEEIQQAATPVPVLRMPQKLTWEDKLDLIEQFSSKFKPDVVSFQYVPYSFHEKGLPFQMIWKLKSYFEKVNLQLMMHELWVDGNNPSSIKNKILAGFQKSLLKLLISKWKPSTLSTSIPLYKQLLKMEDIAADVIPIFSNISNFRTNLEDYLDTVPEWLKEHRNDYLIGCIFGSFYDSSWDLEYVLNAFVEESRKTGKKPMIYSIGNLSAGKENWKLLAEQFPDITFLTIGAQTEETVSYWLTHFTDFGLITTPYIFAGKSGSYMAFKQHGITCLCDRQTLKFEFPTSDMEMDDGLIPTGQGDPFYIRPKAYRDDQVTETAELTIRQLSQQQIKG